MPSAAEDVAYRTARPRLAGARDTRARCLAGFGQRNDVRHRKCVLAKEKVMSTKLSKLLTLAAVVTVLSAIHPGISSAQTSGVGPDGFTRILWRGTDGRISLWKLNAALQHVSDIQYGPYAGWDPIAMTVGTNNNTYVLWRYTDNSISLWRLDSNLNLVTSQTYGPYAGWKPQGLGSGGGQLRVIWRYTVGQLSVWSVDQSTLGLLDFETHGPFFGFDPGAP
jgi:hypothetical protein